MYQSTSVNLYSVSMLFQSCGRSFIEKAMLNCCLAVAITMTSGSLKNFALLATGFASITIEWAMTSLLAESKT
jgi:hypothetical protein